MLVCTLILVIVLQAAALLCLVMRLRETRWLLRALIRIVNRDRARVRLETARPPGSTAP